MSKTPNRRRVVISSDEEDEASERVVEQKSEIFLSEDESDVVESSQNGSFNAEGSLNSPILAGNNSNSFNSSKDNSGFSTSTPRSKPSRRSDFHYVDRDTRDVSLDESSDDLRPGDRSRSFHDSPEKGTMSPISKKLSERNDAASNQKLRERLLRKAISSKKGPVKEKDELLESPLSPIPRNSKNSSPSSSIMSVQDVSSDVLSERAESSASRKSDMEGSILFDKKFVQKNKNKSAFDADDLFDAEVSSDNNRSVRSVVSMESLKSVDRSKLPRKSTVFEIDSNGEDSDDSIVLDDSEDNVGIQKEQKEGDSSAIIEGSGSILLDDSVAAGDEVTDDDEEEEEVQSEENKSQSIVCLSSDDEVEQAEESIQAIDLSSNSSKENSPESKPKALPAHLARFANETVEMLENRKALAERTLKSVAGATLQDGGAKLRQTLADLDAAIKFKKSQSTDAASSPQKPHTPPRPMMPQQRPMALIPLPAFDPAQYGQMLANDKKRLFGGKMTDDRWRNIQNATERSLKGMHEAMNTRPDDSVTIDTPKGLKLELMDHQKQALAWLVWRERQSASGGILADDMGLGKTLSTIALIVHQKNERLKRKEEEKDEDDRKRREVAKKMGYVPSNTTLVVAPASLIHHWRTEIERRLKTDKLHVAVFHGPKNKRESDPRRLAKYDVVVTTYNLLATELAEKITTQNNQDDGSSDSDEDDADNWGDQAEVGKAKKQRKKFTNCDSVLMKVAFERIILDEAHQIKNKTTGCSKAACRLAASSRWCLTGTPIHNNLWDLFSLIRFLRVAPFDDESHWKEYIMGNSQKCADRLNLLTRNLLLRRTKEQICTITNKRLVDLKPKVVKQHDLVLEGFEAQVYDIMFTATQQKVRQMLTEAQSNNHERLYGIRRKKRVEGTEMKNPFNFGPRMIAANDRFQQMSCMLVMLLRLRQACVHMHLTKEAVDMDAFEHLGGAEEDADAFLEKTMAEMTLDEGEQKADVSKAGEIFEKKFVSCKLKKLLEIVDDVAKAGEKIVIVSQWTSLLNIVEGRLKEKHEKYTSITGAVAPADRQERVDSFNKENGGARVMLLSLTAGGVGLNLVGGNHLVMCDLHWNPALEAQACDRIYRMGQKRTVHIHRLIVAGTIEQRVLDLQQKKLELAGAVLDGAASKKMNKLSYNDLKFLFDLDDKKKDAPAAPGAPRVVQPPVPQQQRPLAPIFPQHRY